MGRCHGCGELNSNHVSENVIRHFMKGMMFYTPLTSVDLKAERVRMLFHQMTLGDLIDVQACNEDTPDTLLFRIIDGSVVVRLQTYDLISDQMYRRALVSL